MWYKSKSDQERGASMKWLKSKKRYFLLIGSIVAFLTTGFMTGDMGEKSPQDLPLLITLCFIGGVGLLGAALKLFSQEGYSRARKRYFGRACPPEALPSGRNYKINRSPEDSFVRVGSMEDCDFRIVRDVPQSAKWIIISNSGEVSYQME